MGRADDYPIGHDFSICSKEQKNRFVVGFDLFPVDPFGGGDGAADEFGFIKPYPAHATFIGVIAFVIPLDTHGTVVECPEPTIYATFSPCDDKGAVANDDELSVENPRLTVIFACCG